MTEVSTPISLLRTKLHRPPIQETYLHRQSLLDRLNQHVQRPLTLVVAPAGYGKTVLVSSWLESMKVSNTWLSIDRNDNDLRQFISYFSAAVQTIHSDTGTKILDIVNALTLPPVSVLANMIINILDEIEIPFILVLDDFHLIKNESILDLITQLLHHPPQAMHLVLVGRRDPFLPIASLRAKGDLNEIRTHDLRFNEKEIAMFLAQQLGMQVEATTVSALEAKTEGWVTGLLLAVLSMRHRGNIDLRLLEPQVDAQYVMEYLFTEVFSLQPKEIKDYLVNTAVLDRFCGPLCEAVSALDSEKIADEFSGWEFIKWLKKENMFLIPLDADNRWFRYHHLFQKLLLNQLQRSIDPEDFNILHNKASDWHAENGLIEEAIKHALAGGDPIKAGQLIIEHGFDLTNNMEWPRLQRWLAMLPDETVDQEPELLVLVSWLHVIFSRFTELVACLNKLKALPKVPNHKKHLVGHINILSAFHYSVAADGAQALICAERALKELPREHYWAWMFSLHLKAAAHQVLGETEEAYAAIETQMRHIRKIGGVSKSHFLANQCFIHWMEADLVGVLRAAEGALKSAKDHKKHQAIYQSNYFMGIAYYHRNELQLAENCLDSVINEPYAQHALNFAHAAFALALIYQAQGRVDKANQLGETVVSFGLDTNHPVVLKIARAFEAELALRQGRLAEATYWAEQFDPEPFTLMYRFYVPQMTLAKVLMAQDTDTGRKQAAGLIRQLYEFVTDTHSKRFQIDVLALEALFRWSQGKESEALERLTHSLQIAEPHGYIRLFIDLGPQMADLLRMLAKHNVSVGYIGKIMAVFREEAQGLELIAADKESSLSGATASTLPDRPAIQPLVEPLTKRELDVLEMLEKRLSNKEIAAKLFISPKTVKKHLDNIYGKLNVNSRLQAVEKAVALGILPSR